MVTRDRVLSLLSELLVSSQKYKVSFADFSAEATFTAMSKPRVKDIDKRVARRSGKLPECVLLKFDTFEGIIIVEDIIRHNLLENGVQFMFPLYTLEIVRCV